jgi:tripartite-type tricarboxylate transporter receptor subunit TctC
VQTDLRILLAAALAVTPCGAVAADRYPDKPIRFLVPYPPGGSTDPIVRIVSQKLSEAWKEQIVIDNRGGGGGNVASDIVAKAPADGYTVLLGTVSTICINPALYPKLPFDPVKDLAPVSLIVSGFYLLATHPSFAAASVADLVAVARSKPGHLNYASGGAGSAPHLAMELLKQMAKIELTHVPYKGTGPALNDVVGGHLPMLFGSAASILPLAKANRVKVLAMTGAKRSATMPEIPTVAEGGFPGFEVDSWYGMLAPARTPPAVMATLHREVARAVQLPDVRARFAALGLEPVGNDPAQFAKIIRNDLARWADVVRRGNIRID